MDISSPVTKVSGIGEKIALALKKLDIYTVGDLLYHIPRDYRDYSAVSPLLSAPLGESRLFCVRMCTDPVCLRLRGGMTKTSFYAGDDSGALLVVYFNQEYLRTHIKNSGELYIYGKKELRGGSPVITAPEFFFKRPRDFEPVYPLARGVSQSVLRKSIAWALSRTEISELYSADFIYKFNVMPLKNALRLIHSPNEPDLAEKARERLVFDEFMTFMCGIAGIDDAAEAENAEVWNANGRKEEFISMLGFEPTGAQRRVMDDIDADITSGRCMNRLVQGDVGCGKTILAFYAMYCAEKNGCQSALMAPTEILARQHYEEAKKYFDDSKIALVAGSLKVAEKRAVQARIASGEATIIIGTHALIFDGVAFENLGLIITDEQHKFGVAQRARLSKKQDVHTLIMSATPIPRSLLMALYGKSKISVVDELPAGRQKVSTYIIRKNKYKEMLGFIKNEAQQGNRAYIVCPLIEENDEGKLRSVSEIKKEFDAALSGCRIEMLHGKMKAAEKERIMNSFAAGDTDILISTTVVEVGINVPEATVMCVINAERFGLAQLHQLRGRVGRGSEKSYCFLVSDETAAQERLAVLVKTGDGFIVAQKDMEMRGGGDIFGKRQHGDMMFKTGSIVTDAKILEKAKNVLEEISESEEFAEDYASIKKEAERRYGGGVMEIVFN